MGKGSRRRPEDYRRVSENWDGIDWGNGSQNSNDCRFNDNGYCIKFCVKCFVCCLRHAELFDKYWSIGMAVDGFRFEKETLVAICNGEERKYVVSSKN